MQEYAELDRHSTVAKTATIQKSLMNVLSSTELFLGCISVSKRIHCVNEYNSPY